LAHQVAASPGAAVEGAGADAGALPQELARLRRLLEASSLDALPLFERLLREHRAAMEPEAASLEASMESFDLARAAALCPAISHRLEPNPQSGRQEHDHAQTVP
jgi:hypothetical protein